MPRRLAVYKTPTQLTGLVAWFKADALGLSDGAAVGSWTDSSGSGNTATQTSAGAKPTFKTAIINGQPIVRFNGSNVLETPTPTNFDLATPSIFIVAQSTVGNDVIAKSTTAFGDNRRRKLQVNISSSLTYSSGADGVNIGIAVPSPSLFNIYGVITRSNSDHDLLLNGTATNSTTTLYDDNFNSPAGFEIGAAFGNGAEALTGDVAEIIIYNTPLVHADMIAISNYLAIKYGLTNNILGAYARGAASNRQRATHRVHI